MFREAAPIGHLDVQLVAYYGDKFGHTKWVSSGEQIAQSMNKFSCVGGYTQIGRVLKHALHETEKAAVQALVFIGDAMEESLDELVGSAGRLGEAETPIYIFQEGRDPVVRNAFRLLALASGGAYFEFNPDSEQAVKQLSDRLNAIARLAVGDVEALQRIGATAALMDQRIRMGESK
jgi:hypothetical protein